MTVTDIVPATNMAELDTLDPQSREVAMLGMLEQAHTWLAHAVETSAPARDIADFKAFIATAADAAKRLKVSKEIQVDAEVMVRRSERALGQSIRGGQEAGEIRTRESSLKPGGPAGKSSYTPSSLPSPREFFHHDDERSDTYAMTDDVNDDDFETALTEAKDEGNVSRANVVRKIKAPRESTYAEQQAAKWDRVTTLAATGSTTRQIAADVGMSEGGVKAGAKQHDIDIRADRVVGRTRRLDSNRIIRECVAELEGVVSGLALVNYNDIDPEEAPTWVDSLTKSMSAISKANRQIKESLQ